MCTPGELEEAGVTPGMLRLSLGLEQVTESGKRDASIGAGHPGGPGTGSPSGLPGLIKQTSVTIFHNILIGMEYFEVGIGEFNKE